jgi:hypothetical protein
MHLIGCSKSGAELGCSEARGSEHRGSRTAVITAAILRNRKLLRAMACLFAAAFLVTAVDSGQQAPPGSPDRPYLLPEANRPLDANQKMQMQEQQQKKANFEAANAERKKQLTDDSAHLLKLANELKTEVDKTDKDTLSISVIRKADEIERLAHIVKEKMKLTVGAN